MHPTTALKQPQKIHGTCVCLWRACMVCVCVCVRRPIESLLYVFVCVRVRGVCDPQLQQRFCTDIFKSVQQEYDDEGIAWTHVDFKVCACVCACECVRACACVHVDFKVRACVCACEFVHMHVPSVLCVCTLAHLGRLQSTRST